MLLIDPILICNYRTVVDSLNYYPEDTGLYSTTGCKRVAQRVAVYVATERFHRDFDDEL